MLVIRFQRVGRKNDPAFRVVLTEKRSKPKSGEIEILGSYHPKTKETNLRSDRILYWISKGARLSPRVHNLLVTYKIIDAPKINVVKPPQKMEAGKGAGGGKESVAETQAKTEPAAAEEKKKEKAAEANPETKQEAAEVPAGQK